jgi:hypothetical protein
MNEPTYPRGTPGVRTTAPHKEPAQPDHAAPLPTAGSQGELPSVQLACGHDAELPGPAGTPTGRAWCIVCGESAVVSAASLADVEQATLLGSGLQLPLRLHVRQQRRRHLQPLA